MAFTTFQTKLIAFLEENSDAGTFEVIGGGTETGDNININLQHDGDHIVVFSHIIP
jgi:hypothetical protein